MLEVVFAIAPIAVITYSTIYSSLLYVGTLIHLLMQKTVCSLHHQNESNLCDSFLHRPRSYLLIRFRISRQELY